VPILSVLPLIFPKKHLDFVKFAYIHSAEKARAPISSAACRDDYYLQVYQAYYGILEIPCYEMECFDRKYADTLGKRAILQEKNM
jgi:hypothetical protein